MQFREKLKAKRKELRLTQIQVAEALHITKGTVSQWETGLRTPCLESLERWAGLLGYSVGLVEEVVRGCE